MRGIRRRAQIALWTRGGRSLIGKMLSAGALRSGNVLTAGAFSVGVLTAGALSTVALTALCTGTATAAVLGHFDNVHNGPGYIEYDPQSPGFQSLYASKQKDGMERRTPSKILFQDYINDEGFVRLERIQHNINSVREWLRGSFIAYCSNATNQGTTVFDCRYRFHKLQDPVRQQWANTLLPQTAFLVMREFERAAELSQGLNLASVQVVNSPAAQKFLEVLFQALELQHALYNEWEDKGFWQRLTKRPPSRGPAARRSTAQNFVIKQHSEHAVEAVNLQHSSPKQVFYGPRDLLQHPDISLLDPIPSGFWRRPEQAISDFDTSNYNHELRTALGDSVFHKIQHIEQATTPMQLRYVSPVAEGKVPQLKARQNEFEFNLKLTIGPPVDDEPAGYSELVANFYRHGSGVRSSFVANNLAAALGFTVAPTYYKREVHLFFDDDNFDASLTSTPEGKKELQTRFLKARRQALQQLSSHVFVDSLKSHQQGPFMWDYKAAFRSQGTVLDGPHQGRHFVRLKSVGLKLLHVKGQKQGFVDWRVGSFHKYTLGKHLKREFRAFLAFYLWLSDRNIKDAHSSLGVVRQGEQGEVKVFYTADEMGDTLGGAFANNKPNYLSYDMVEPVKGGLHFPNWDSAVQYNPAFQSVTWADLKWLARLMVQLTEDQIRRAFLTADYPDVVAELYTQKLLRRRDQLVKALGLEGEPIISHGPKGHQLKISSQTSKVPDNPAEYFVASCRDCFYKGELAQLPEGVQSDENFAVSMYRFPKGIIRDKAESMASHMTKHALTRIIGRYASKITYGVDWMFKKMDGVAGTWLPSRYLVENPFDDPERPFWVVDSFYMYAGLGYTSALTKTRFWPKPDKQKLWQRYLSGSLDVKTYLRAIKFIGNRTFIGKHAFQLFEFVRVKPVGYKQGAHNLADVVKLYNPKKLVAVHMGGLKRAFVEGLDEGDFLVSSRHRVMRGYTRVQSPIWKPMFELDFAPTHLRTDRIVVYKKDPNTVLMHWLDSDRRRMYLEVDFETMLFELPIFAKRTDHAHGRERTYMFDVSDPKQQQLVVKYLDRDVSDGIPNQYKLEDTQIGDHIQGMRASFFGIGSKKMQNRLVRARIKGRDDKVLRNFVLHSKTYRKQPVATREHARLHTTHRDRGVSSYVDLLTGDLMVKVDLFMEKQHAQRKNFAKMRNAFRGMIPSVMLQFDDQHVNYYLGTLSFEGRVLLSSRALAHIFEAEQDASSLCRIYATYTRVVWSSAANTQPALKQQVDRFCDYALKKWPIENASSKGLSWQAKHASQQLEFVNVLTGVHWFSAHFLKAQKKYKKFKALWAEYEAHDHDKKHSQRVRKASVWMAKALTDLFKVEHNPGSRHLALLSMAPGDSIYREAYVKSSHDALPGQQHSLALADSLKGNPALKHEDFWHMVDGYELISATLRPALVALTPFFIEQKLKAFVNTTPVGRDILSTLTPGLRQIFYNNKDDKPKK